MKRVILIYLAAETIIGVPAISISWATVPLNDWEPPRRCHGGSCKTYDLASRVHARASDG